MDVVGCVMALPLSTTTISILRKPIAPFYESPGSVTSPPVVIASGIKAHISAPSDAEVMAAGTEQSNVTRKFDCDPCSLTYLDLVKDESTGLVYKVIGQPMRRTAFGMDFLSGTLRMNLGSEYA